jgi:hypothetical protein
MKIWILGLIAVLLLVIALWSERFEATPKIRTPPYNDVEKVRIYGMLSGGSRSILMSKARLDNPTLDPTRDGTRLATIAGGYVTPAVESFFTTVYKPATTTLTEATVDTFMASRTGEFKAIEKEAVMAYFINQASIASSGYLDVLAAEGQGYAYTTAPTGATGPPGPLDPRTGLPVGPTGATGGVGGGGATGATGGVGGGGGAAGGGAAGGGGGTTTTGTTTGGATASGSTTTTPGPTNGLFGPPFTEFGDPAPRNGMDSSQFTSYPQVLGGMATSATTVEGVGVTSRGSGSMYAWEDFPTMESLGAAERSQYFPFSRTPGDMDRIPDPFRVAQTFDLSRLASKTEPVPFLTDFSAFQK